MYYGEANVFKAINQLGTFRKAKVERSIDLQKSTGKGQPGVPAGSTQTICSSIYHFVINAPFNLCFLNVPSSLMTLKHICFTIIHENPKNVARSFNIAPFSCLTDPVPINPVPIILF